MFDKHSAQSIKIDITKITAKNKIQKAQQNNNGEKTIHHDHCTAPNNFATTKINVNAEKNPMDDFSQH